MSLLMEALRKAEEAKSRAAQEEADGTTKSDLETSSNPVDSSSLAEGSLSAEGSLPASAQGSNSSPEKIDFRSGSTTEAEKEVPAEENIDDYEFFLNSKSSDSPKPDSPPEFEDSHELENSHEPENNHGLDNDNFPESNTDAFTEEAQAPSEEFTNAPSPQIDSDLLAEHQSRNNSQNASESDNVRSVNSLFQAKLATQKQKLKKVGTIAALLLLIPIGGGGYWYYSSNLAPSNSLFPTNVSISATSQRFLGDTSEPVSAEVPAPDLSIVEEEEVIVASNLEPTTEDLGSANSEEQLVQQIATLEPPQAVLGSPPIDDTTNSAAEQIIETPIASFEAIEMPSLERADSQINFIRTVTVNELDPQLSLAYTNYQNGNYPEALSQYQAVLNNAPNDRDAILGLASTYKKQENQLLAQGMYSRLLQLNPRDPLARAGLLELTQASDPLQQESELKSLIQLHPDIAPLAFALGNLYASQNRWNEAQSAYFNASMSAKAAGAGSVSPDYPFNLAVSLEQLNQLRPAYTYYQEALELSRNSVPGFDPGLLARRLEYLEQTLQ